MLREGDTGVREHAVNHILATRARGVPGELRQFVRPKINFSAASLTELVQWDEAITEPPLTMELSDSDLRDAVEAPLTYPPYMCHSQAVERWVAEVTEAAGKKVGHDASHRFILACERGREQNYRTWRQSVIFTRGLQNSEAGPPAPLVGAIS